MRRDNDLLREILFKIEKDQPACQPYDIDEHTFPHHDLEVILAHVQILDDAGYVVSGPYAEGTVIRRVTAQGYDFLDSIKDPGVWSKTKKLVSEAGGATLQIIGDVAKEVIKQQISGRISAGF